MSTSRSHAGPRVSNSTIVEQLTVEIEHGLADFHRHCKDCRRCRNPRDLYRKGREYCDIGLPKTRDIERLIYLKAEHVPKGTFKVEAKQGWFEVWDLIEVICHFNQGEFTNRVIDLKRAKPASAVEEPVGRGSGYEEDMRRHQAAATRNAPSVKVRRTRTITNAAYGDPHTSLLDIPTARGQTAYGTSPPSSNGSSSGHRSVHFDNRLHIREFQT